VQLKVRVNIRQVDRDADEKQNSALASSGLEARSASEAGSRQSRVPSLTVGLLNRSVTQISSPRVSKGSTSTQGVARL